MAGVGPRAPRRAGAPAGSPVAAGDGHAPAARAVRFVPPVALMALIWFLSSRSHLGTDLGWIDTVLRKGAHMTEYALLTLLWTRALARRPLPPAGSRDGVDAPAPRGDDAVPGRRAIVAAAAVALAWAAIDELHQATVPGRVGTPWDVAIDAAGVGIAVALWRAWTLRG
jgi:VanZ family protein